MALQPKPPNTPLQDLVILAVDSPQEFHNKRNYYLSQGYRQVSPPYPYEDVLIDLEGVNGPIVQIPKVGATVTFFTRKD